MHVQIKKLHPDARIPTYANPSDAGLDLYTVKDITIAPMERVQIPTGIAIALPEGYVALIWDKSGLSHTHGLKTLGGVIDAGYRGECMIGVINLSKEAFTFRAGEKVAQVLIQPVAHAHIDVVEDLPVGDRGENGFGSTGKA